MFKFAFYVIFFAVMFTLYGVPPLNLVRDIYMSFDQLQRRLQALFRYPLDCAWIVPKTCVCVCVYVCCSLFDAALHQCQVPPYIHPMM